MPRLWRERGNFQIEAKKRRPEKAENHQCINSACGEDEGRGGGK